MTSTCSDLVVRWCEEARRQEYWTGAGWTADRDQAALMSAAEARRTAATVGGRADDAWDDE